jgi:hypothetical protein
MRLGEATAATAELVELLDTARTQLDLGRLGTVAPRLCRAVEDARQRAVELDDRARDDLDDMSCEALYTEGQAEDCDEELGDGAGAVP